MEAKRRLKEVTHPVHYIRVNSEVFPPFDLNVIKVHRLEIEVRKEELKKRGYAIVRWNNLPNEKEIETLEHFTRQDRSICLSSSIHYVYIGKKRVKSMPIIKLDYPNN